VHRDFKPDNVLVEEDGKRVTRVLVSDFGLARAVEAAGRPSIGEGGDMLATAPGAVVGTPAYMAPEQLEGAVVDVRADVFAFGVGLWEALYGARPYAGNTVTQLIAAMVEPLPAPTGGDHVPRWLERVLRHALAIDPATRYASMDEVLRALDWRQHLRRARRSWSREYTRRCRRAITSSTASRRCTPRAHGFGSWTLVTAHAGGICGSRPSTESHARASGSASKCAGRHLGR
jgi:serine/threonine protein kinase